MNQTNATPIHPMIKAKQKEIIDIAAKYGASNIRVFGSYARGEQTPDSDLDLLIDLQKGISLFDRIALKQELEDLLGVKVDITKPENLHEIIREKVLDEAMPL
ncbi:MAG: nucleotidyltransferase [Cyanobacteria bacterium]|jgi:predicted nucleotidyltransferase|nr:nucleotidyltransferase [Cyanobacteria bacterium GSL.Bin21]